MCGTERKYDSAAVFMKRHAANIRSFYNHSSARGISSLSLSHHSHYAPVSHHCLLSISVDGTLCLEQYFSHHLAGEILSNRCTLCRNLVLIFYYKDSLMTLRTGVKGVALKAAVYTVELILCAVNALFSWMCYCMVDDLLMGCFIL